MSSFQAFLASLKAFAPRHPFAVGVGISAVKTSIADGIAQFGIEGRDVSEFDARRNMIFCLWGAGYLGGVQYFIYNTLFTRVLFPGAAAFVAQPLRSKLADRAGQAVVLKQVGLDQFLHHPFLLFPAFYTFKQVVEDGGVSSHTVGTALNKYRTNMTEDLQVCWQVWIPAFLFNFSVCPIWARVPFVAGVSLGFTAYLSSRRGGPQGLDTTDAAGAQDGMLEDRTTS